MSVVVLLLLLSHCTEGFFPAGFTVVVVVVLVDEDRFLMGCGVSKVEDLPLVSFCRERKDLIKSAADHRFSLAAAHIAYFHQLRHVGDSLCRFVDEELILSAANSSSSPSSPSSLSSPVLTLPSDEGKPAKNTNNKAIPKRKGKGKGKKKSNNKTPSSSASISHKLDGDGENNSHLQWSSASSGSDVSSFCDHDHDHNDGHFEIEEEEEEQDRSTRHGRAGKVKKAPPSPPKPGISYVPPPTSNYPYSFDPTYQQYPPPIDSFYGNPSFPVVPPMYGYNSNDNAGNVYASSSYYPGNGNENLYGPSTSYGENFYGGSSTSYTAYHMKKSSTRMPSVIYEEPKQNPIYSFSDSNNQNSYMPSNGDHYPNYPNPPNGGPGYFGFMANSASPEGRGGSRQQNQQEQQKRPPTPPSPKVSAWDYFNPFETFDGGVYPGYFSQAKGGYGSNTSSPDSREVREREGIPDLEEETESEVMKEPYIDKRKVQEEFRAPKSKNKTVQFEEGTRGGNGNDMMKKKKNDDDDDEFGEGTSKGVPTHNQRRGVPPMHNQRRGVPPMHNQQRGVPPMHNQQRGMPPMHNQKREVPMHNHQSEMPEQFREPELEPEPLEVRDGKSSSPETDTSISTSIEEVSGKKKGVSFEVDETSHLDMESSKPSSLTTLSAHGTRDLREVVREIKEEFEAASDYGKEVSVLLEVDKEPYKARKTFLKVMLASVCSTSLSSSHTPSNLAGGYPGDPQDDLDSRSLASTLEKLYVWEKKLYKEVKDEERLRVMYEKQLKRLKSLDDRGAESSKVEATQASIRKLLTKINVSVKAVDSISSRIHKVRDNELQPRLKELIYGLRRMWKLMLKCHHKQFQAILESRTRALKANTGLRKDSSVRATIQLEAELLKWCHRFNNWVEMQRSYAETLNSWLMKWLQYEPEITADGEVPFSPSRIGAPAVFVISHDWKQAMERISASEVQTAMHDFATSLHQLWERQDEEQQRRLKAESVYKDFEKQIRVTRLERQKRGHEHDDALSDKNSLSMVASESGISPLDDLKVDLDSMRQRVKEERAGHKEAVKLVHDAVSRSIQAGLVPIFEALESFTSEASKAFNDVRVEHVTVGS